VVSVAGKAIRMAGVGERLSDLEPFHPDRMAARILGMGDVLTLVEKAQESVDAKKAEELERKLRRAEFNLEDLRDQLKQMRGGGLMGQLVDLLPGGKLLKGAPEIDERRIRRYEAIICSMTATERRRPDVLNGSRRKRIARGAGTSVEEVNRLLRQYAEMRRLFKRFGSSDPRKVLKSLGL